MILSPRSRGLPSVAHILSTSWKNQIRYSSEMLIVARDSNSSVLGCSKIKNCILIFWEDRNCLSEQPESRNATIRVHIQPDMGICLLSWYSQLPAKSLRGAALLNSKKRLPLTSFSFPTSHFFIVQAKHTFNGDCWRVITREERRIYFNALNDAGSDTKA